MAVSERSRIPDFLKKDPCLDPIIVFSGERKCQISADTRCDATVFRNEKQLMVQISTQSKDTKGFQKGRPL